MTTSNPCASAGSAFHAPPPKVLRGGEVPPPKAFYFSSLLGVLLTWRTSLRTRYFEGKKKGRRIVRSSACSRRRRHTFLAPAILWRLNQTNSHAFPSCVLGLHPSCVLSVDGGSIIFLWDEFQPDVDWAYFAVCAHDTVIHHRLCARVVSVA